MTLFKISHAKLRRRARVAQPQRPVPPVLELVGGGESAAGARSGRPPIELVYSRDSVKRPA